MELAGRLEERGLKFKHIYFAFRMLALRLTQGGRVTTAGWNCSMERLSRIVAAPGASVRLGKWLYLRFGSEVEAHASAGIVIGDHVFVNKNCSIVARASIHIGNHCLIGDGVSIYDHDHVFADSELPFQQQGFRSAPVKIGSNVWIGAKVFIGKGVTIGDNVVIGAHSLITEDIAENTIVYGEVRLVKRPLRKADTSSQ